MDKLRDYIDTLPTLQLRNTFDELVSWLVDQLRDHEDEILIFFSNRSSLTHTELSDVIFSTNFGRLNFTQLPQLPVGPSYDDFYVPVNLTQLPSRFTDEDTRNAIRASEAHPSTSARQRIVNDVGTTTENLDSLLNTVTVGINTDVTLPPTEIRPSSSSSSSSSSSASSVSSSSSTPKNPTSDGNPTKTIPPDQMYDNVYGHLSDSNPSNPPTPRTPECMRSTLETLEQDLDLSSDSTATIGNEEISRIESQNNVPIASNVKTKKTKSKKIFKIPSPIVEFESTDDEISISQSSDDEAIKPMQGFRRLKQISSSPEYNKKRDSPTPRLTVARKEPRNLQIIPSKSSPEKKVEKKTKTVRSRFPIQIEKFVKKQKSDKDGKTRDSPRSPKYVQEKKGSKHKTKFRKDLSPYTNKKETKEKRKGEKKEKKSPNLDAKKEKKSPKSDVIKRKRSESPPILKKELRYNKIDENGSWLCPRCSRPFVNVSNRNRHLKTMHGPEKNDKYPCSYCDAKFGRVSDLKDHMKCHKKNFGGWVCEHCNKTFENRQRRDEHIRIVHKDPNEDEDNFMVSTEIEDEEPSKITEKKKKKKKKSKNNTDRQTYKCQFCSAKFGIRAHRDDHEKNCYLKHLSDSSSDSN